MSQEIICSIIIPVYNGSKFIEKTIKSCLDQTLRQKIEIIAVDDCSKDDSYQILSQYSGMQNITIIKNEVNLGLMKTNNKAASMAQGTYLLFLGHDDMLEANHVEVMVSECDENVSLVHCNANLIDENDQVFSRGVNDTMQIYRNFFINYYISTRNIVHSTGALVSKKHFDMVHGWSEVYKNYGEWLLWAKLSSVAKVKYTTKVRALYRRHATNITNTFVEPEVKKELYQYRLLCTQEGSKNIKNPFVLLAVKLTNIYINAKERADAEKNS